MTELKYCDGGAKLDEDGRCDRSCSMCWAEDSEQDALDKAGRLYVVVCAAYKAFQSHPRDTWRVENQPLYCALRDGIAEHTGGSPEQIQDEYEGIEAGRVAVVRQAAALIEQLIAAGPGSLTKPEREYALELVATLRQAGS